MITIDTGDPALLLVTVELPRLDAAASMAFKEQVRQHAQAGTGRVMLDMHRVEFLDSSGLGALVAIMKALGGGRRLELARCGDAVRKVLALTRMDQIFVLHDALPNCAAGGPDQTAA
ncbi:STAS domain-containing protein [Jannaschia marina]|uniref:STAS domain-containing protein n=1 Tax=Jannaschia marina TaxID=2741674 RepID=UPI001F1AA744|nr:STAS domain-containing protein [Jannaschia marina]